MNAISASLSRRVLHILLCVAAMAVLSMSVTKEAKAEYTPGCLNVAIYDYASNASAAELSSLAEAIDEQFIYHWNPLWQSTRGYCVRAYFADVNNPIPYSGYGTMALYVSQYPDPGPDGECAAYHSVEGSAYAWVCDSYAGYGVDMANWSNTISHEALEMATNPVLDQGVVTSGASVGRSGKVFFEYEIAGPVMDTRDGYAINSPVDGRRWIMSNFVKPRWFWPNYGIPAGDSRWLDARGHFYGDTAGLLDWYQWTQLHDFYTDYLSYYYPANDPDSCYYYGIGAHTKCW